MKKRLVALLCILMSCSFAACSFAMPNTNTTTSSSSKRNSTNRNSSRKNSSKNKSSFEDESSFEDDNSSSSFEETEDVVLYQAEDIVREDLMWDLDELYAITPEIKEEGAVYLGENIQTFKFKGPAYKDLDETWVFAAMGMPTSKKPAGGYPAILLLHGGGGTVSVDWINYWNSQGYVAFAFDGWGWELNESREHVKNPEGGPENVDGSNYASVDNPEDAWVYHVVYNSIMANNILRAQSSVDEKRIVVTGNSWGGYATCVLSGVDKRFAAFAPLNGCGYLYTDSKWAHGPFGGEEREKWISLYDPSSYLPYATKPMLFVSGVDDEYFSAYNRTRSAMLVPGKTFFSQRYSLNHANWKDTDETAAFFSHVLYQTPFSQIGEPTTHYSKERGDYVTFDYEYGDETYEKVYFVYTDSTAEDSHTWEWKRMEVEAVDGEYFVQIDYHELRAYFFETVGEFSQSTPISIVMGTHSQYY